jgi:prepilin-type N-terminal cleavage/methylation domain-containing protein
MRRVRGSSGYTLVEVATVMVVIGILTAIVYPRMRISPIRTVATAARQLAAEVDVARTRAMAAKQGARLVFDVAGGAYTGYLDVDNDSVFDESTAESVALRMGGRRPLPDDVGFGRGAAGAVPTDSAGGVVTFPNARLDFDARGVTSPFGTRGTVYLVHRRDPKAVAAVAANPSGALRVWVYRNGAWE